MKLRMYVAIVSSMLLLSLLACVSGDDGDDGSTGQVCGTRGGVTCMSDEICKFPQGTCGATDQGGECVVKPDACAQVYDPVCGCDGETYSNACMAMLAGVSVESDGECAPPTPGFCGGIAGFTCQAGEYCDYGEGQCAVADAAGTCKPQPSACTRDYRPVCGCDGKTYSNACTAASAGMSIDHTGACSTLGEVCGTRGGVVCGAGEYCKHDIVDICGWADAPGVCTSRPQFCTQIYDPVCGCDGKTYGNACEAAIAGSSVQKKGACNATN